MRARIVLSLTACTLLAASAMHPTEAAKPAKYDYYLTGNGADVTTPTSAGTLLMGGGTDVDAAFQWQIDKAGGGDLVVIRVSGADGYNDYVYGLGPVDSVETLVIQNREAASDPFVIEKIRNAEALFIAGGDQADYVNLWKGTPIEDSMHELVSRGVPVGGTSAGLAILGEFSFTALNGTVTSSEALANPFNRRVVLDSDFLHLPRLAGVITDSHFVERDRMGRLVTFLARIVRDGWATEARGVGIDSQTAVLVEGSGSGRVVGTGTAYFLQTPGPPEVCEARTPLTYERLSVYRIDSSGSFDLSRWRGSKGSAYEVSAIAGTLTSTQPDGGPY
jgi:cyanophycinase